MYRYMCLNPIAEIGLRNFTEDYSKTESMDEADVILVRSAVMHEMEIPGNVQAIARAGAGVNNIPLERCAEQGIVVFNTPGANANGVKELVFAGMLLAARDILGGANWTMSQSGNENIAKVAEKEKKKFAGHELMGKKLGIIGLGAIGGQVANAAIGFGMDVYGYDPYISVDAAWNLSRAIHHINDVDEIYRTCDYITIHVPLMDATRKMINADALSKMKDGVVILNFARDLLVDEEAVLKAVEEGKVHRYVSDFPNPLTVGKKGVIVTPHLGASTAEAEDNCAVMAVKQLKDFLENGNIVNSVNYPNCNLGKCQTAARLAVFHLNIRRMISRFTSLLEDTNIVNMSNKSKGEYAYTMFDLDDAVAPEVVKKISAVPGVIKVRVIK